MYRLYLLGCVVLLAACRMKDPEEGILRITVKYRAYQPACVRVEVSDRKGHHAGTDIPFSQFNDPDAKETRVAMVRRTDWDQVMNLTVSSFDTVTGGQCSGAVVETQRSSPLDVPPGQSAEWSITLLATDADGDGYVVNAPGSMKPDCYDTDPRFHPGAEEECSGAVDFNCNMLTGCQETNCRAAACDDGNLCTDGDHCEGSGVEARCLGTTRQCSSATGCIVGVCDQGTGQCSSSPAPAGKSCVDSDACTVQDTCNGSGTCVSGTPTPCPEQKCFLPATSGCAGNNSCSYLPDPAQVGDFCLTPSGDRAGVCRKDDGACRAFPYKPSNFDPDAVDPTDLAELLTSGPVTFNSDTLTWAPDSSVTNSSQLKPRVLPQVGGALAPVLIPVNTVVLGGTLTLVGSRPVILAVYGDATLNEAILASGRRDQPGAGGNQACALSKGANGSFSAREGGGGGGGGNGTTGEEGGLGYSGAARGQGGAFQSNTPQPLIGGCPGGDGGGEASIIDGKGGAGGGAIQISVARTLSVSKSISASGGGGSGGKATGAVGAAGGGGGGSGGRVVLEAFEVALTSTAQLTANGGGGGEGGGAKSGAGNGGANGADGSTNTGTAASGGIGGNIAGGRGGAGGASSTRPVKGDNGIAGSGEEGGGGGGGGAVGSIHLRSLQTCSLAAGHVISPPATGGCQVP